MITQLIPILYFQGLVYQNTAIPPGQFCLSGHLSVVCSTCLSGSCIQQCCPPGQVRREDRAWRQPRCGAQEYPPIVCAPTEVPSDRTSFTHGGVVSVYGMVWHTHSSIMSRPTP